MERDAVERVEELCPCVISRQSRLFLIHVGEEQVRPPDQWHPPPRTPIPAFIALIDSQFFSHFNIFKCSDRRAFRVRREKIATLTLSGKVLPCTFREREAAQVPRPRRGDF